MLARTQLLRIQRALYEKLKALAHDLLGPADSELRKYFAEYHAEWRTFEAAVPYGEIQKQCLKSDLILAGDYHTLAQAQRAALKLIETSYERLKLQNRKIILALEFLSPSHQKQVDAYLAGKVTEEVFLKSIHYDRDWGFPWENYRPLFALAREKKIALRGISRPVGGKKRRVTKNTLTARDAFAAKEVARFFKEDPNAWVMVLIGDLHLTSGHLGKRLQRELKAAKLVVEILTVLQNHEPFYWKLAEKGLDQFTEALRIDEKTFCLMNTPPWVKLQSHLKWMDVLSDFPHAPTEISLHAEHRQARIGRVLDAIDHTDDIQTSITSIENFLGLTPQSHTDFSVAGPEQRARVLRSARAQASRAQYKVLSRSLKLFKSHFIPGDNVFFFSTLSLNHSAAQAAVYLHSHLSGFTRLYESFEADFHRFVWVEALAFFGSKVINNRRKCQSAQQLAALLGETKKKSEKQLLEFTLGVLQGNATRPKIRNSTEKALFGYKVAKLVGRILGEALYAGVLAEDVRPAEIKSLFHLKLQDYTPQQTAALYTRWARRLQKSH